MVKLLKDAVSKKTYIELRPFGIAEFNKTIFKDEDVKMITEKERATLEESDLPSIEIETARLTKAIDGEIVFEANSYHVRSAGREEHAL